MKTNIYVIGRTVYVPEKTTGKKLQKWLDKNSKQTNK